MGGLDEFGRQMSREEIDLALQQYDLPAATDFEAGTGTASPKITLTTGRGRLVLKRRRREFSPPEVVAFDHSVLRHLHASGVPVAPPIRTRAGASAVFSKGWAYEVVPFLEGIEPFDQELDAHVASAARMLARVHECTEDFQPEGRKNWPREFHAAANALTLAVHLAGWEADGAEGEPMDVARRLLGMLETTARNLTDEHAAGLPHCITHGDYTCTNVLFRDDRVAAVFDFDWTGRQPRIDDVARGIVFFAFKRRKPMGDGSIWSLVQAWEPDVRRARLFLESYTGQIDLTGAERACLPWFIREISLSMRVRAMRKVADGEKLKILTFDIAPVLDWLEHGAEAVVSLREDAE